MPAPTASIPTIASPSGYQRAEYDRPQEKQDRGGHDGNHARHDGDTAFSAEERQPVGQLRVLELVIADSSDNAGKNTDKRIRNLVKRQRLTGFSQATERGGDDACESRFVIISQDTSTPARQCRRYRPPFRRATPICKQDRHGGAVHQRKRRLHQKISDLSGRSGDFTSLHGRRAEQISDTGKDTAIGRHATGSIRDFPSFCKYFIVLGFPLFVFSRPGFRELLYSSGHFCPLRIPFRLIPPTDFPS